MTFSALSTRSCLTALLLSLFLIAPVRAQSSGVVDEIVAVVGNDIVLRSEVDGIVYNIVQQGQAAYTDGLWLEMLDQIVDQKVMAVVADRDTNITITDTQVDQAIDGRIDQLQRQVGGRGEIERMYGKPIVQIRADLRRDFRGQLLAQQLQQQHMRSIRITPTEVRAWFTQFPTDSLPTVPESVRLSHIVRHPEITDAARDEAMEIISTIRESVVGGQSTIEEMARQYSDDPGSADRGGHYESTRLTDLVPEFAAVAARSPIDAYSQVFESPFGLHFLRVNQRRGDVINYNHVLIEFDRSKADPAPAIAYLESVRDSIETDGLSFEVMARRHSEEEQTSMLGGRVVDLRTGDRQLYLEMLGPDWRRTIQQLEVGEISQPTRVQLLTGLVSYHIVQLRERTPEHRLSLDTDYERIEQLALQEKQQVELQRWARSLRNQVHIEMRGKARDLIARN